MENDASPVLDPDTIAELRRTKAEYRNPLLIRQLVTIYRTNAPKRVEQLRHAVANADVKELALVAHTLKTNCAMLGALKMAALCATLEESADNGVVDDAARVLAQVEDEFARVLAALTRMLADEPGEHA
ncbi:MAG: Hpt domain-containing protein [Acidobacteriota bacterium]